MKEEKIFIKVLGKDRKQHIAEPHLDTCKCGEKILFKYVPKKGTYFSCYECTYQEI